MECKNKRPLYTVAPPKRVTIACFPIRLGIEGIPRRQCWGMHIAATVRIRAYCAGNVYERI